MTTQTTGLLGDQERTIFRDEAARRGWALHTPRVEYDEQVVAEMIGGDVAIRPMWSIRSEATRDTGTIAFSVTDHDPDLARLHFRRMVEGLPDQHGN